jgi:acetyltransferase-like isoleucine patch superfamily enzyme
MSSGGLHHGPDPMTFRRALTLFARRMLLSRLANWCPFVSGRLAIYRLMGMTIGRGVFIGFYVEFDTNHTELIRIADGVTISHRCIIATHMATDAETRLRELYPARSAAVEIREGAWICTGAIILPGVTIGAEALVAAGAVVTRDVAPRTLVAGVPAKPVKKFELPHPDDRG